MIFDTWKLLHAWIFSASTSWIQGLSFVVCFKRVVSCCDPHYFSRTSPLSIHLARNSRIWWIYCDQHTFALKKSLKSCFCDFEAWIEETDCADFVNLQWGRLDPWLFIPFSSTWEGHSFFAYDRVWPGFWRSSWHRVLFFFFACTETQPNHWTQRMMSTWLTT